ncbi:FtsW/RodA/SpoVE family cell cycle protein [Duganella fentianensis]|uniref:FtsW/RodA/SpoVE family cell cycle protein n=1 Tax=Duganella fentianensis TaxID=2692177 RepID=UPI0032B28754
MSPLSRLVPPILLRMPTRPIARPVPRPAPRRRPPQTSRPRWPTVDGRSALAICAALLLPAALLALHWLALTRAPAAWQPAAITLRLAAGESIDLGGQELAATHADRRHLRVRRDAQRGWMVQNLSSSHALLLQTGALEQPSGALELQAGQRVQIGTQVLKIEASSRQQLAFSAAGHQWRYDGALLYRDGQRQAACPQTSWPARLAAGWNSSMPHWLTVGRPLTLGGNLYCDNRLGLELGSAGAARITAQQGHFILHTSRPDAASLPVLLLPEQLAGAPQDLRRQELLLSDGMVMIVGHTRLGVTTKGDSLTLRPSQHVRLFATPELPLPPALHWEWRQRQPGLESAPAAVRTLAMSLATCAAILLGRYLLTMLRLQSSALPALMENAAALLLLACAATALYLQRSLQAVPAMISLLLAGCALLLWLAHPARRNLLGICAASLLALGLLSQLELGLGASDTAWLRYYQKSCALLALGMSAAAVCLQWLQTRQHRGRHLAQTSIEWLLAGYAAFALAGLLLQVVLGDETGVFDLQPVELAKLALAALSAHCLALRFNWHSQTGNTTSLAERSARWLHLIAPALLFLMLLALALVQVDDFSPLILLLVWTSAIALAYAVAAQQRALLATILALGLLTAAAIAALRLLGSDEVIRWGFYADRFLVWLQPALHPHTGQQLLAGAQAIAAGGWWGSDGLLGLRTLGQPAGEVLSVPAIQDDFAASFFLNRHGLLAGLMLWCLQAGFLHALLCAAWHNYRQAVAARHFRQAWLGRFRYLMLTGAAALVFGHFLLSWGTNLAIFPIMGQPMSFLSAGGSHLLFFLCPLLAFSAFNAPSMQGE